jgi:hypothetical protein
MTFTLDAQVAAVLAAAVEQNGPPPAPPVGDVAGRRVALDAMLDYFNNHAQPVAGKVDISDHRVVTPDGAALLARWYRQPSSESRAAVLYLHGGGMILGSVPVFHGPVSRYVDRTGVPMLSLEYRLAPEHPHPAPVEDEHRQVNPSAAPGRLQDAAGLPPPTSRWGSWTSSATRTSATPSPSARRACRSNSTCTPACRTSTTPSPSAPTCRAAHKPTATACSGACDPGTRQTAFRDIRDSREDRR